MVNVGNDFQCPQCGNQGKLGTEVWLKMMDGVWPHCSKCRCSLVEVIKEAGQ